MYYVETTITNNENIFQTLKTTFVLEDDNTYYYRLYHCYLKGRHIAVKVPSQSRFVASHS